MKGLLSKKDRANEFLSITPIGLRKKSRKRKHLSADEKIAISFKVICEKESQDVVAKEFRVTS